MLLNPSDEFEIDFYSSSSEYPKINVRIAGISKVDNTYPDSKEKLKKILTAIFIFFLLIYYIKHLQLAVFNLRHNPRIPYMLNNVILGLSCGFGSARLFVNQFGIENQNIFLMLILIPMVIGLYSAYREYKYNK
jgi:hypothetical protein